MLVQQTGLPTQLQGSQVVAVVSSKTMKANPSTWQSFIDRNTYYYQEDQKAYHLGLISSWQNQTQESFPLISELISGNSEILVDGFYGRFQFDKPFYDKQKGLHTVKSAADQGDEIGADQTHFYAYLSEKVYPGDVLQAGDLYDESVQMIVVHCEQADLTGSGWKVVMQNTDPNPEAVVPNYLLEANIKYTVIDHKVVEYDSQFSGVDAPEGNGFGTITAEFVLGGARGVEGYVTGFADAQRGKFPMANAKGIKDNEYSIKIAGGEMAKADADAFVVMAKPLGFNADKTMKYDINSSRATTVMEYLVEKRLMQLTARSLMWNKFGQVTNENGAISYINEGLWHQLRRGYIIQYPRPKGLTRGHIAQAVEYIFQANPNLPWEERKVKFKVGREMQDNILEMFQDEVKMQLERIQASGLANFLFGSDGQIPNSPVSGGLDTLKLALIRFIDVPLIGIAGSVTVEHDPALDNQQINDFQFSGNHPRGAAYTTYSAVIWDVTDQAYTNNKTKLPSGVDLPSNADANVYLVRPESGMTYKGRSNGRWDIGKASDIISSSKYIAQEFWAFNSSAVWLRDPSKTVVIELAPQARLGFVANL